MSFKQWHASSAFSCSSVCHLRNYLRLLSVTGEKFWSSAHTSHLSRDRGTSQTRKYRLRCKEANDVYAHYGRAVLSGRSLIVVLCLQEARMIRSRFQQKIILTVMGRSQFRKLITCYVTSVRLSTCPLKTMQF